MSKVFDRANARAVAANPDGKARGPGGRKLCRWCGTEVSPPRRTFCSSDCVDDWNVRQSPSYAREQVFERDKGVCALCGVDTIAQAAELKERFRVDWRGRPASDVSKAFYKRLRELHVPVGRWQSGRERGCWDMDHTTPVVEGGGSCGLENLRTLCMRCHWQQTSLLKRRHAVRKKRKKSGSYELF